MPDQDDIPGGLGEPPINADNVCDIIRNKVDEFERNGRMVLKSGIYDLLVNSTVPMGIRLRSLIIRVGREDGEEIVIQ